MFCESNQTVSLTWNGGIGRHQVAEWTSYCLRHMRSGHGGTDAVP